MEHWTMFGGAKKEDAIKSSVLKEYIVPMGSLFLAGLSLFSQNTPPLWVSVAIVVFVAIVFIFLVVPALMRNWAKVKSWIERKRYSSAYLPQVSVAFRSFKAMVDSRCSDTLWEVWNNAARTIETQKYIRPNHSFFYAMSAWHDHLGKSIDSAKPAEFQAIVAESASWVQQYISFCRDAYSQFESLLRDNNLDESNLREIKQSWNHVRDAHNQAVSRWKSLCEEINASFGQDVCSPHYETLRPLE